MRMGGGSQQSMGDKILDGICDVNPEAIFVEGFNDAILGMHSIRQVVIYDMSTICDIMVERDGMDMDEAEEFFHFNIGCMSMGKNTPLFVHSLNPVEYEEKTPVLGQNPLNSMDFTGIRS